MAWPKGKPRKSAQKQETASQAPQPSPSSDDQPDISGSGVVGSRNADRLAQMDALADAQDAAAEAYEAEVTPITAAPDDEPQTPVVVPAVESQAEPEVTVTPPVVASPDVVDPPAPRKLRLKVNGKEADLTEEEVVAMAQKNAAADEYLAEAKNILLNARQLTAARAAPPAHQPAQIEEDDLALARALQAGSEEEAAKAIQKIRSRAPTIDPTRIVDERLAFRKAIEQFHGEFPEIVKRPDLLEQVQAMDDRLIKAGDQRPYLERYRELGEFVQWKAGLAKPAPATPDRLARKATVTPITQASGRATAPPAEEPEESLHDTLASMAKARGQGVR